MTSADFMRRVREQATSNLSQASLEFAVLCCRRDGRVSKEDVPGCIKLATFAEEAWSYRLACEASRVNSSPDVDEALSLTTLLTSDDLLKKLQPLVKATRENIFHHDHAPFSSKEAAADWIRGEASAPRLASDAEKARLIQLDHALRENSTEWYVRTGMEWRETGQTRLLAYEDSEEGGAKTVRLESPKLWEEHPTIPSPALIELERAVAVMADVTGFYKDSLVTYILTGIPPTLSAIRTMTSITHHEMTDISRTQGTIDLLTGDVRFEELHQAYHQVRKRFSTTRKKRLSPQNAEFLALVKQHGPVPLGRGSKAKAFWENIRLAWHKKQGRKVWKDAWTARRHYNRLITRAQKKGIKR